MCTVRTWPEARSPRLQVRLPAVMAHWAAAVPPLIVQVVPASVGIGSVTVTPLATPGPLLVTVIVKPIVSPAETDGASATFSMSIEAPSTTTWSVSSSEPSLVVVTWAVLTTGLSATVALVVGLVMCTVRTWPEARSPRLQVRVPMAMAHWAAAVPPLIVQLVPASVGIGSVTVTPLATPGPLLVTVIRKPIASPAETDGASATFSMSIEAHWTVMEPVSVLFASAPDASFVAEAVAELSRGPQKVLPARFAETVYVFDPPGTRSPTVQSRTCAPSAPVIAQPASPVVQWTAAVPGSASCSVTAFAVPWPMFSTLIENVAVSPALIVPPSGVLVTFTSGQFTVTDAEAESVPSLVVVALPVLSTAPHVAGVVGLVMWTWNSASLAIVTPLAPPKLRMPPASDHVPVVPAASMDQLRPAFVGTVSVTLTPNAEPGPLLVMLSVNPMLLPAATAAWSAVLVRSISAGMTWTHSVVLLVWLVSKYFDPAAGVYSARKQ